MCAMKTADSECNGPEFRNAQNRETRTGHRHDSFSFAQSRKPSGMFLLLFYYNISARHKNRFRCNGQKIPMHKIVKQELVITAMTHFRSPPSMFIVVILPASSSQMACLRDMKNNRCEIHMGRTGHLQNDFCL